MDRGGGFCKVYCSSGRKSRRLFKGRRVSTSHKRCREVGPLKASEEGGERGTGGRTNRKEVLQPSICEEGGRVVQKSHHR